MTTIYNQSGLQVDVDSDAVVIYIEGRHAVEMTRAEFNAVCAAMEGMKDEQV